MKWLWGAIFLLSAQAAQAGPLFESEAPIRITIKGPIGTIARTAAKSTEARDAVLTLADPAETHAIRLSPRGISRRKGDICEFPPLRVEFAQPPAATSLFAGQRRLKLVTHCRPSEGFQQHLLLEYSIYRMFNQVTPLSYRARLATVEYIEPSGRAVTTRWGFFIEDLDDVAKRNGMKEARVGDRVPASQLEPQQAARIALLQYMIGNLDWSMRAGPAGEGCCHNSRLLAGAGGALVPIAYDFDYSGLVNAPYAVPPEQFSIGSVRTRVYQGYCRHNAAALAVAAELRARRAAIEGVFGQIPGMTERTRSRSIAYLSGFFKNIATDGAVRNEVLKKCIG